MPPLAGRDRCGTCGAALGAGVRFYSIHEGRRKVHLCRPCLEDSLDRLDVEAHYQDVVLEACWALPSHQTSVLDGEPPGVA